jgi:uncharacterized protein (DUF2252 family)
VAAPVRDAKQGEAPSASAGSGTPEGRRAVGRAARTAAPRSGHADPGGAGRQSPVATLAAQDTTRVPELVPIRYGRMLVSPFTFFRGAAAVMAADLAPLPRTGLEVQLCGDAHLSNFGVFRAPSRRLVFDMNDFDETHPGPFEWDLKRLVASFEIAGRDRGFSDADRRRPVVASIRSYREAMGRFAGMRDLDVWYARLHLEEFLEPLTRTATPEALKNHRRNLRKARNKDSLRALDKLTEVGEDGSRRIARRPPLLVPLEDLAGGSERAEQVIRDGMASYRRTLSPDVRRLVSRYRFADAAHKVVGVGSVGNRAWVCLLLGRDGDDPLFLQLKEAQASVLEPHTRASVYRQHGRRVVEGQRLIQAASDQLLGWVKGPGLDGVERDFYVRQLWDGKGSAEIELMGPAELEIYGRLCGWTLARAHARTGDAIAISGYIGRGKGFERALAEFAVAYADRNQSDFDEVAAAARDGKIEVRSGL